MADQVKVDAAIKEAIATLYVVKERLVMGNYGGEEDPFIEDCDTALQMLEEVKS